MELIYNYRIGKRRADFEIEKGAEWVKRGVQDEDV